MFFLYSGTNEQHRERGTMEDVIFYAIGDVERLSAETIEEAVNNYAQEYLGPDEDLRREKVMVQPYKRGAVSDRIFQGALESIAECIQEDHGDPCGDPPVFSEKALEHFEAFKKQFLSDYTPWQCDPAGDAFEVTVGYYYE